MTTNTQDRATENVRNGTAASSADETEVHALFQRLIEGWSAGDGAAYAAAFTEDADYIAFDGSHIKGRRAIAESHQRLFDTWLKGTRLDGKIESVRFLVPDVALVVATGGILMPGRGEVHRGRRSIQTLLGVKRDGWRFASFHNNRIQHRSLPRNLLFGIATRFLRR